ncbi:OLC1v1018510C1 [Oldenlandia corymbosa var. corymbosa]|uniref:mannan endo-1,4-beta-mannosidase n=1 Tax=Oldenlandia corymbosa var. corymbosa TaxID=529605 RepID=A0AAV1EBS0_OLDCO|nr:OLC1v1018510C1 [Oldenlandia corymbosa var. corymbosa]
MATHRYSFVVTLVSFFLAQHGCEARVLLNNNNNVNNVGFVRAQAAETCERYKVSEVFRDASAAGLSVCRTWAFRDGGDRALQISPATYDECVFQGDDNMLNGQEVQELKSMGTTTSTHIPLSKDTYYKDHIKRVLTRYNTIVTRMTYIITAWELMNEPRCQTDYSGRTAQEMASFVKSLDRKHMLEIGMGGFYGDGMPEKKQNNPGISRGDENAEMGFRMTSHWEDANNILKKPLVIAEFGKSSKDPGFTQLPPEMIS